MIIPCSEISRKFNATPTVSTYRNEVRVRVGRGSPVLKVAVVLRRNLAGDTDAVGPLAPESIGTAGRVVHWFWQCPHLKPLDSNVP